MSDMTREEAKSWIIDHWGNDLEDGTKQSEVVKICLSALSENKGFDGMTNGEVIQALFPKIELGEKVYNTRRYFLMGESIETFEFNTTDRWWNAPYEKECIKTLPAVEKESCRCNTCRNNDDELSGECYECIKGIFDHYEPEEIKTEVEHGRTND